MLRGVGESVFSPNTYFLTFPSVTQLKSISLLRRFITKKRRALKALDRLPLLVGEVTGCVADHDHALSATKGKNQQARAFWSGAFDYKAHSSVSIMTC